VNQERLAGKIVPGEEPTQSTHTTQAPSNATSPSALPRFKDRNKKVQ
jgi:hypothetical protein